MDVCANIQNNKNAVNACIPSCSRASEMKRSQNWGDKHNHLNNIKVGLVAWDSRLVKRNSLRLSSEKHEKRGTVLHRKDIAAENLTEHVLADPTRGFERYHGRQSHCTSK